MIDPTLSSGAGDDKDDSGKQQESNPLEVIEQKSPPETSQDVSSSANVKKDAQSSPGKKEKAASEDQISEPKIVVRYGLMKNIGEFRNKTGCHVYPGMRVVVRTNRGVELGHVVCGICCNQDQEDGGGRNLNRDKIQAFLGNYENKNSYKRGGRVLRLANEQDLIDYRHLEHTAFEAGNFCREKIRELKLPMRPVKVEHLLGGEKIIFHFTSESRVDFRELVRQLASRFRTRIEMHQVGARDEARLVADFERCGRQCCCKSFLKELKPVSMKMAKIQKATLDPTKISGRCGRLMCCLRYEDEVYNDLRKNLPRKNTWVRTEECTGRVLDTQILTQLVRLWKPDNTIEAVSVDSIIERNLPEPSREEQEASARELATRDRKPPDPPAPAAEDTEGDKQEARNKKQDTSADGGKEQPSRGKGRRRKRRRRKRKGGSAKSGGGQNKPPSPKSNPDNRRQ